MNCKYPRMHRVEFGNRGVNPLCVADAFGRFHIPPEFRLAPVSPFKRNTQRQILNQV